jgi:TPR repeat protein
MNRWINFGLSGILVVLVSARADFVAGENNMDDLWSPLRVGALGRPDAFEFHGNATFGNEQIVDALAWDLDYQLAAHPRAPWEDFARLLERNLVLGYQRAGFPEASVRVSGNTTTGRTRIDIQEGPRYRSGEIVFHGNAATSNDALRRTISHRLQGLAPIRQGAETGDEALWNRGRPAPFDPFFLSSLTKAIIEILADLNHHDPRVNARLEMDVASNLAHLHIDLDDVGARGVIEEIAVTGLQKQSLDLLLEWLGLAQGQELQSGLLDRLEKKLKGSGRFLRHTAELEPLVRPGSFRLNLALEEFASAPPLDVAWNPEAEAVLRFSDWLMEWEQRPENLVLVVRVGGETEPAIITEVALSSEGVAVVARISDDVEAAELQYALVLSPGLLGMYSGCRQSKYVASEFHGQVHAFIRMVPHDDASETPFEWAMGLGFNTKGADTKPEDFSPIDLAIEIAPVAMLALVLQEDRWSSVIENGVLTIRGVDPEQSGTFTLQVEAASGRLIHASVQDAELGIELKFEAGAFARIARGIAASTGKHRNEYVRGAGVTSWLAFMITDLIESPWIERAFDQFKVGLNGKQLLANQSHDMPSLKTFLAQLRDLAGPFDLASVFEPLNPILQPGKSGEELESFVIPFDPSPDLTDQNLTMRALYSFVLSRVHSLFETDSWPGILLREATLIAAGRPDHAKLELMRLYSSEELGPLSAWMTASFVRRLDPRTARLFAWRGLRRLTPDDFHRDYQTLLDSASAGGQVLANALRLIGNLNERQTHALTGLLHEPVIDFIRELARHLDASSPVPVDKAAWPVFVEHWETAVAPLLGRELGRFHWDAHYLADSQALYERGEALLSGTAGMRDFEQAFACFYKAATQGHGQSQFELGTLYERGIGVARDYAQAIHWYTRAADQQIPHAACRLGDLHAEGRGVARDRALAIYFYRIDASGGCVRARSRLGVLLSEGGEVEPDLVEATQWLILAAEAGNPDAIELLPRIREQLTPEELHQATRGVDLGPRGSTPELEGTSGSRE